MTSQQTNVRPVFAIPEDFSANEIHYDVDVNLLPNPQDRVDKNKVQWETL